MYFLCFIAGAIAYRIFAAILNRFTIDHDIKKRLKHIDEWAKEGKAYLTHNLILYKNYSADSFAEIEHYLEDIKLLLEERDAK